MDVNDQRIILSMKEILIVFNKYYYMITIIFIISLFPNVNSIHYNNNIPTSKIKIDSLIDDLQGIYYLFFKNVSKLI